MKNPAGAGLRDVSTGPNLAPEFLPPALSHRLRLSDFWFQRTRDRGPAWGNENTAVVLALRPALSTFSRASPKEKSYEPLEINRWVRPQLRLAHFGETLDVIQNLTQL